METSKNQESFGSAGQSGAAALLEEVYRRFRRELTAYVARLVVRQEVAEELVQQAAVKWIEAPNPPADIEGARAWLFRVSTNLAIDYRRRHSTWRETILLETRERAVQDEAFLEKTRQLAGSPEMKAIAREHLTVCFACTLRNLPVTQSATLLLVEVNEFTLKETANILELGFGQVKHALQSARNALREKYGATCQLVTKEGVCHQCTELERHFNGREDDPLEGTSRDIEARIQILRERKESSLGPWHRMMMRIVDELLQD